METESGAASCPYRSGKADIICEACGIMVPSIEEEKKYCESSDFKNCPYYQAAQKRERENISR